MARRNMQACPPDLPRGGHHQKKTARVNPALFADPSPNPDVVGPSAVTLAAVVLDSVSLEA